MASRLRRHRRTKIVATIGPASSTPEILSQLFETGADVFRLNFSHGTHEDHLARLQMIRALERKFDRPIGILADVQGPKLRVGQFRGGRVQLQTGAEFQLDLNPAPAIPAASTCRIPRSSRPPASAPPCCSTTASCACGCCASARTTC